MPHEMCQSLHRSAHHIQCAGRREARARGHTYNHPWSLLVEANGTKHVGHHLCTKEVYRDITNTPAAHHRRARRCPETTKELQRHCHRLFTVADDEKNPEAQCLLSLGPDGLHTGRSTLQASPETGTKCTITVNRTSTAAL